MGVTSFRVFRRKQMSNNAQKTPGSIPPDKHDASEKNAWFALKILLRNEVVDI